MALTKHTVKENTFVQDRGNFASNRFSIITEEESKMRHYKVHVFKKGDEILGARRTEIGVFLFKQHLLEENKNAT